MSMPYWIEYINLNAQAQASFLDWISQAEQSFAAEMQQLLLADKQDLAKNAAIKLKAYQEIAHKFKIEIREKQSAAEYADKLKGGN